MTPFDFPGIYEQAVQHILNRDRRHIFLDGGRAGGKTQTVARALIATCMNKPTLVCCGREFENTTADSVHRAISSAIEEYQVPGWKISNNKMKYPQNGSEIIFKGLRTSKATGALDAQRIKSLEGVNIFWGEEAQSFSAEALDVLIPTIRTPGSLFIWTSNRVLKHDPVRARIAEPLIGVDNLPDSKPFDDNRTFIQHINSWDIEGYLPVEIKEERENLRTLDPENFRHVWLGEPLTERNGGIFTKQLAEARNNHRVGQFPYDDRFEVYAAFDLGTSDSTAICLFQIRDGAVYFIDYIEDFGRPTANYFTDLRAKGYRYNTIYLPHDANHRSNRAQDINQVEATTLLEDLEKMLPDFRFRVLPPNTGYNAINLARGIFPTMYFNQEHCARLLDCLEGYHYEYSENNKIWSKTPKHDWSSHGADAFQYAVMAVKDVQDTQKAANPDFGAISYTPKTFRK